jgi:hypothetical protein
MCCEPKWGYPSMEHHLVGGCCMPHGHHHLTLEEEREMLESNKRDLEDEISRIEARIKKISK